MAKPVHKRSLPSNALRTRKAALTAGQVRDVEAVQGANPGMSPRGDDPTHSERRAQGARVLQHRRGGRR